jgi:DNA repair ATPase RecN
LQSSKSDFVYERELLDLQISKIQNEISVSAQSFKSVQILANTVPTLKDSLQKSITGYKHSQTEVIDLKSKLQDASKSLGTKDKEFRIAEKNFNQERKRFDDLCNDILQSRASVQTGSEKLDREFQNAFKKLVLICVINCCIISNNSNN